MAEERCTWFEDNETYKDSNPLPYHDKTCPYSDKYLVPGTNRCIFHLDREHPIKEQDFYWSLLWLMIHPDDVAYWTDERNYECVDLYGFIFPQNYKPWDEYLFFCSFENDHNRPIALVKANLEGNDFSYCVFENRVRLQYSILRNSKFHNANLKGALISFAEAQNIEFNYADLRYSNLSYTKLNNSDFTYARLQGANLEHAFLIDTTKMIATKLQASNLTNSEMTDIQIRGTNMEGAVLCNATLTNSNIWSSSLIGVDLRGATLCGATINESKLSGADLLKVKMNGTIIRDCILSAIYGYTPQTEWQKWIDEAQGFFLAKSRLIEKYDLLNNGLPAASCRFSNIGHITDSNSTIIEESDLRDVDFTNSIINGTSFNNSLINGTSFRNVQFGKKDKKGNWDNKWYSKRIITSYKRKDIEVGLPTFEGANVEASDWADNREAQRDFVYAEFIRQYRKKHRFIACIWRITCDYGRSLWRWATLAVGFMLLFALIYYANSFILYSECSNTLSYLESLYFSIVAFTTLGFGDITPAPGWGQAWVAAEVILGYIMLGGLISIFAVKVARRD